MNAPVYGRDFPHWPLAWSCRHFGIRGGGLRARRRLHGRAVPSLVNAYHAHSLSQLLQRLTACICLHHAATADAQEIHNTAAVDLTGRAPLPRRYADVGLLSTSQIP